MQSDRYVRIARMVDDALQSGDLKWEVLGESLNDPDDREILEQVRRDREAARRASAAGTEGPGTDGPPGMEETTPLAPASAHSALAPSQSGARSLSGEPHAGATTDGMETRQWGKLELVRRLGRGAFGDVYLARDPDLDRHVALKLYRRRTGSGLDRAGRNDSGSSRAVMVREARLMARVRHPNVVVVYGAEEIDGRVGIWMDYIRGQNLHEWIEERGRLGAQEAILIGLDLCRALAAVHATGLVHHDVKAQNVMREEGGRIVLMDFGIGAEQSIEESQISGEPAGTPVYMAPETLLDGTSSPASDQYAVGVLLYYLVAGSHPVTGESMADLCEAHRLGRRRLLRDARPDLPLPFVEVVERALQREPRRRFASMGDMEGALAGALGTSGTDASRPRPSSGRFPAVRRGMVVGGAAILIVTLAVAGLFLRGSWKNRSSSGEASLRRFTTNAEENPVVGCAISLDGGAVAYADRSGGYILDLGTNETTVLPAPHDMSITGMQWFPGGKKLLLTTERDSAHATYALSLLDGSLVLLCESPGRLLPPDYKRMLVLAGSDSCFIQDLSTGRTDPIDLPRYAFYMAVLSPGGERWIYPESDRASGTSLKSVPFHGGEEIVVLEDYPDPGNYTYSAFTWMDDGRLVYAVRGKGAQKATVDLFWLRVDPKTGRKSGRPHRIAVFDGNQFPASMSASSDGRRLAVLRTHLQAELMLCDLLDGGSRLGPEKRLTLSASKEVVSDWTPDSKSILFTSDRHGSDDLFLQDCETSALKPLVAHQEADEGGGRLILGGTSLLYWSRPRREPTDRPAAGTDSVSLCLLPLPGSAPRTLARFPARMRIRVQEAPSVGRLVLGTQDSSGVAFEELDPASGLRRPLARYSGPKPEWAGWALSPDGRRVAIVDWMAENWPGVKFFSLEDGHVTAVAEKTPCAFQSVAWSPDGQCLFATGFTSPEKYAIFRIRLDGHVSVLQAPTNWVTAPLPSPDGKRLAFSRLCMDSNAWLIEDF